MKLNNMPHTAEPLLVAKGINKYFHVPERFQVLSNINFHVMPGEFLALTGKSGCGKSSLLHIVSGMDTVHEGEVVINGEHTAHKTEAALSAFRNRHIGFVFKFHYLLPGFTVLENVMMPALKLGEKTEKEIEHNAIEKLTLTGMEAHAMKQAASLSSGYLQRAAIARALINDPALLVCDEPTGNLDSMNTRLVFTVLEELSQNYKQAIVLATHDRQLADHADRVIEMHDGKIVCEGVKEMMVMS
jgi:lipoprotein-releasing system ATP-binding protein